MAKSATSSSWRYLATNYRGTAAILIGCLMLLITAAATHAAVFNIDQPNGANTIGGGSTYTFGQTFRCNATASSVVFTFNVDPGTTATSLNFSLLNLSANTTSSSPDINAVYDVQTITPSNGNQTVNFTTTNGCIEGRMEGIIIRGNSGNIILAGKTGGSVYDDGCYVEYQTGNTPAVACTADFQFWGRITTVAVAANNFTIVAQNNETLANSATFNATLTQGGVSQFFSTSSSSINSNITNGTYNVTVSAPTYFPTTWQNIDTSASSFSANLTQWAGIQVTDNYDNLTIGTVNVTFNGTTYTPTSATNLTFIPVRWILANFTMNSSNYAGQVVQNHNTSANRNVTTWQAVGTFTATQLHTGLTISNANFTVGTTTSTSLLWLRNTSTTVSVSHGLHRTTAGTISPGLFSNTSYTVTNVSTLLLNVSARAQYTNAILTNFSVQLQYGSTLFNTTTTNGTAFISIANTTYNVTIYPDGYQYQNVTVAFPHNTTLTAQYQFTLYTTNTFEIEVRDEDMNTRISANTTTFTFTFVGDTTSFTRTTTNGTLLASLIVPDTYDIRYDGGDLYPQRHYYTTLVNNSAQNLTLYALNNTRGTQTVITLENQNSEKIEGGIVKALRFYAATNTYRVVAMSKTNSLGQAGINLVRVGVVASGEIYKFIIVVNDTVQVTNPGLVFGDATYKVGLVEDFLTSFRAILGVNNATYNLSFNNDTSTFIFTWNDDSNIVRQGCLRIVQRSARGDTTIHNDCTIGSSGSASRTVNRSGTMLAFATIDTTTTNSAYLIDILEQDFARLFENFGKRGVYYQLIVTVMFTFALVFHPAAALIGLGLSYIFGAVLGLMAWPWSVLAGFLLLIGIAIWRMRA